MRKLIINIFKLNLALLLTFGYIMEPFRVYARVSNENDTLKDLKDYLKELEVKKSKNANEKKRTESEIASAKNSIQKTNNEITKASNKVDELSEEITKTNNEIKRTKEETESLLILYEKMQNENVYVDYVSGASSITELIMRIDAINQITDYNNEKIDSLKLLIKNNEKMSKELDKYQVELNNKIDEYEKQVSSLGSDLAKIMEGTEDINSEIKSIKESIAYYEKAGCKDNDKLSVCIKILDNASFTRPLTKGVVTSMFGWRNDPLNKGKTEYHSGTDIGGNSEGTNVYAPAAGVIGKITRKSSCGGNMVYIWSYVKGTPYTIVLMHLLTIKVDVGDEVTVNTVIGTVGGGAGTRSYDKCSTGAHLHYGVSKGNHYLKTKSETYSKFTANLMQAPGFDYLGYRFYSRYI